MLEFDDVKLGHLYYQKPISASILGYLFLEYDEENDSYDCLFHNQDNEEIRYHSVSRKAWYEKNEWGRREYVYGDLLDNNGVPSFISQSSIRFIFEKYYGI